MDAITIMTALAWKWPGEGYTLPNGGTVADVICHDAQRSPQEIAAAVAEYEAASTPSPKAAALAALAARRWEAETGGITVDGLPVATDDRSKTLLMGARIDAMTNPSVEIRWKTPTGFVPLTAAQIVAISDAVRAHVQSCFDREAELAGLIEAAEDPLSVDVTVGWPD